jgi:hypothetical protein
MSSLTPAGGGELARGPGWGEGQRKALRMTCVFLLALTPTLS